MICGKEIHKTKAEALTKILGRIHDKRYGKSDKVPSKAYFCNDCNGWHLYTEGKKKKVVPRQPRSETLTYCKPKKMEFLIIHSARNFQVR